MKRDLPGIFANKVENDSNDLFSYAKKEEVIEEVKNEKIQPNIY